MKLADLRESRRQKMARQITLARSTIRDQRSDLARIVSQWSRIAKRVNFAMERYERVIDEVGLTGSVPLRPVELLDCLKACRDDTQISPLDEFEDMLRSHTAELKKAAAADLRRGARRTAKREKRKKKRAKA